MATIESLHAWLERDLRRGGGIGKNVEIESWDMASCRFRFYTDTNLYSISAHDPVKCRAPDASLGDHHYDNGYLGCTASSRKPRAGETWARGSDLADGPLTEETWHAILADIVAYELVKVHRQPIPAAEMPSPTELAIEPQVPAPAPPDSR